MAIAQIRVNSVPPVQFLSLRYFRFCLCGAGGWYWFSVLVALQVCKPLVLTIGLSLSFWSVFSLHLNWEPRMTFQFCEANIFVHCSSTVNTKQYNSVLFIGTICIFVERVNKNRKRTSIHIITVKWADEAARWVMASKIVLSKRKLRSSYLVLEGVLF